jgi:L-seryl-tRNA(Ser) seleniumtransferase
VASTVEPGSSAVGGGAFPEAELPTSLVVLSPGDGAAASRLARRLRLGEPAVIARVQDDRVLLDPRTIPAELLAAVARAVALAAAP